MRFNLVDRILAIEPGRLIQVAHSGSVNNGVSTTYTHDKANNRTNKTTTGAP